MKNKKLAIGIVVLIVVAIIGIVLLLGVTTLILGLLPVGMNEYVQLPNTVYVYCHKTSDFNAGKEIYKNIEGGSNSDVEKINTIYNLFNSSFQQKLYDNPPNSFGRIIFVVIVKLI